MSQCERGPGAESMASVSEGAAGRVSTGALAGARVSLAAGGAAAGATSARVRVIDGPHAGAVRFVRLASVAFDSEWNAEVKGHPQEQTIQQALQHDQTLAQVQTQEHQSHQQPHAKTSRGAATAARCEADTRVAAAIASAAERQRERDKVLAEAKARAASEDAERNRQREEYDANPGAFMKNMPPPPSEEQLEESRKNVERVRRDLPGVCGRALGRVRASGHASAHLPTDPLPARDRAATLTRCTRIQPT